MIAPERNTLQVSMLDVERSVWVIYIMISGVLAYSVTMTKMLCPFTTLLLFRYNTSLHHTIVDEYYRVYPYLCAAVRNFVKDQVDAEVCFLQGGFFNWPSPEFAKCWPVSN